MKKTFLFFLAGALMLAGCEKNNGENSGNGGNEDPTAPSITIVKEGGNLTVSADEQSLDINYTVENAVAGANVEVDCQGVDWIEVVETSSEGKITLNIAENQAQEARSAIITLNYVYEGAAKDVKDQVNLIQEASSYAVDVVAPYAEGYYYDGPTTFGTEANMYLLWLVENQSQDGYLSEGNNYSFAIMSNAQPEDLTAISIPEGVYTLSQTMGDGTLESSNTRLVSVSGGESTQTTFSDVTLTVTREGNQMHITAVMTESNSENMHRVKYTGEVMLEVVYSYQSSLTADYEMDLSGCVGNAYYYGDYYEVGTSNFTVQIAPASGAGELVQLELCAPLSSNVETGIAEGTYRFEETAAEFSALPGYLSGNSLYSSWFITLGSDGYATSPWSPLAGGTVDVSRSGDEYTFDFDALDDNVQEPHAITGVWSGTMTIVDATQQAAPARSVSVSAPIKTSVVPVKLVR